MKLHKYTLKLLKAYHEVRLNMQHVINRTILLNGTNDQAPTTL